MEAAYAFAYGVRGLAVPRYQKQPTSEESGSREAIERRFDHVPRNRRGRRRKASNSVNRLATTLRVHFDASIRRGVAHYGWIVTAKTKAAGKRVVKMRRGALGQRDSILMAEYDSLIRCLRWIHGNRGCDLLIIHGDNLSVIQQLNGRVKPKQSKYAKRMAEAKRMLGLCADRYRLVWVLGS